MHIAHGKAGRDFVRRVNAASTTAFSMTLMRAASCTLCPCAGYSVAQYNVTRVCDSFVPASCSEQCLLTTVEGILAAHANAAGRAQARKQLVATVVPAVVVSGGRFGLAIAASGLSAVIAVSIVERAAGSSGASRRLCCDQMSLCGDVMMTVRCCVPAVVMLAVAVLAAAVAALFWHRRHAAAREAAMHRKYEEDQHAKFIASMQDTSGGTYLIGRPGGWRGPGGVGQQALALQGPDVPAGLLGRPGGL